MQKISEIKDDIFEIQKEIQEKVENAFYHPDFLTELEASLVKLKASVAEFHAHPDAAKKVAKWLAKDADYANRFGKS